MSSAVIILNRNLPQETDELVNSLIEKSLKYLKTGEAD